MPKRFTMRLDADLLRAIDTAAGPRGRTRWLEDAAHAKIENDAIQAAPKSPTGGAILAGAPARAAFEHRDSRGAVLRGLYYPGPDEGCPQCEGSGYIDDETACSDRQCCPTPCTTCPSCNHH